MALNPPLSPHGVPLRVEGEYMVLERKNMEIEIKIEGMKKISGKGKVYLTTARMVFVHKEFEKDKFKAFDIPLAYLSQEKFEQPIFGSNYLKGQTKPLYNMIPTDAHFKIWFTAGGCTTFLKCFCYILDQVRNKRKKDCMPDEQFVNTIKSGNLANQQAFVDPNDPTVIFVSQPQETYNNVVSNQGNYIGDNYYMNAQPNNGYGLTDHQLPQYNQPPPQYNQQSPQYNQQPPQYNQQPPQYNQHPNYNPQGELQQPLPYQNPEYQQPQPYQDPQYQQPPQYNDQNQGFIQQNPPPQNQPAEHFNMEVPQNQQPQPQQQHPNVGYYYGFWGPSVNRR